MTWYETRHRRQNNKYKTNAHLGILQNLAHFVCKQPMTAPHLLKDFPTQHLKYSPICWCPMSRAMKWWSCPLLPLEAVIVCVPRSPTNQACPASRHPLWWLQICAACKPFQDLQNSIHLAMNTHPACRRLLPSSGFLVRLCPEGWEERKASRAFHTPCSLFDPAVDVSNWHMQWSLLLSRSRPVTPQAVLPSETGPDVLQSDDMIVLHVLLSLHRIVEFHQCHTCTASIDNYSLVKVPGAWEMLKYQPAHCHLPYHWVL